MTVINYSLFDATLDLARLVGDVYEGACTTAGSTTTIIDTHLTEPDDFWNGGTVFLPSRNAGAVPAQARIVSDYNLASTVITTEAMSTASAASDVFSVADKKFPLHILRQAVNLALDELGPFEFEATWTSDGSQVYDASDSAAIDQRIIGLWVARETSAPYNWQVCRTWRQLPSGSTGRAQQLEFWEGTEPGTGYIIRVVYEGYMSRLDTDDDAIPNQVHKDTLRWAAAVHAWRWRQMKSRTDEPEAKERLQEAMVQAATMLAKNPVRRTRHSPASRW